MKKIIWTLFILLIPAISLATYSLPASRSVTWAGNAGLGYCSSAYYSKTLCEANGGTWSTTIPVRTSIYATIETASQGDDTSVIQTALNNAASEQVVKLGVGTFSISSGLSIPSNVTLRGSGIDETIIQHTSSGMAYIISLSGFTSSGGNWDDDDGTNITAPSKGDTTISATSAHGLVAGDLVIIDQSQDSVNYPGDTACSGGDCSRSYGGSYNTRTIGQTGRVVSVSGTDFTLEIPIYINFNSGDDPEVYDLSDQGIVSLAGLEDLTVDAGNTSLNDGTGVGEIFLQGSVNCWVYNVKLKRVQRIGIKTRGAYRCLVEKTITTDTLGATSSNTGYMWWISFSTSACLFQNNIVDDGNDTVWTGAQSGNVIAYNYIRNMHNDSSPQDNGKGFFYHGSYPVMNLFEGNFSDDGVMGLAADASFGEHSNNVAFRNYFKGKGSASTTSQTGCISWFGGYNGSFVGNVLGTTGINDEYDSTDGFGGDFIYYFPTGARKNSMLRHRNYDYVNNDVLTCVEGDSTPPIADCQGGSNDTTLPDSLYLTSKPAWFGDITWPPFNPVGPVADTVIPAEYYYLNGSWPEEAADTIAPTIGTPTPNGTTLPCTINPRSVDISAPVTDDTDDPGDCTCEYSATEGFAIGEGSAMSESGGIFSATVSDLACGSDGTYYMKCKDLSDNSSENTEIAFAIISAPVIGGIGLQ